MLRRYSRGHLLSSRFRCGRSCCRSPATTPVAATPAFAPPPAMSPATVAPAAPPPTVVALTAVAPDPVPPAAVAPAGSRCVNNTKWFPEDILYDLLLACYATRREKWVSSDEGEHRWGGAVRHVYCWSSRQLRYFVLSYGTTIRHVEPYRPKFTDEYYNTTTQELPRPSVVHNEPHFLPLVDDFNKDRQRNVALEKCWPTRSY